MIDEKDDIAGKLVLGRREVVAIPEWGIRRVRAKVDTGARTSSIHVGRIEVIDDRVHFDVMLSRKNPTKAVPVEAALARMASVRPSTGEAQSRPVVEVEIVIGSVRRRIELTLVCRRGMLCRMLLGRSAIEGDFLVDPSRKYIQGKPAIDRQRKDAS
ncbi:MAG: ATP-dependent zinc protease [Phycisphaeraceae bacterium]|nr:MAG: ATP-dependent zinc protease [Phycisphaeraceae bacterium]